MGVEPIHSELWSELINCCISIGCHDGLNFGPNFGVVTCEQGFTVCMIFLRQGVVRQIDGARNKVQASGIFSSVSQVTGAVVIVMTINPLALQSDVW